MWGKLFTSWYILHTDQVGNLQEKSFVSFFPALMTLTYFFFFFLVNSLNGTSIGMVHGSCKASHSCLGCQTWRNFLSSAGVTLDATDTLYPSSEELLFFFSFCIFNRAWRWFLLMPFSFSFEVSVCIWLFSVVTICYINSSGMSYSINIRWGKDEPGFTV